MWNIHASLGQLYVGNFVMLTSNAMHRDLAGETIMVSRTKLSLGAGIYGKRARLQ
jgi:hypothetical protein